jgi:WD40 repeat protein
VDVLVFSPNNRFLATAGNILATTSGDKTVRLWAVENSEYKEGIVLSDFLVSRQKNSLIIFPGGKNEI